VRGKERRDRLRRDDIGAHALPETSDEIAPQKSCAEPCLPKCSHAAGKIYGGSTGHIVRGGLAFEPPNRLCAAKYYPADRVKCPSDLAEASASTAWSRPTVLVIDRVPASRLAARAARDSDSVPR
jgi:hypothetical protein